MNQSCYFFRFTPRTAPRVPFVSGKRNYCSEKNLKRFDLHSFRFLEQKKIDELNLDLIKLKDHRRFLLNPDRNSTRLEEEMRQIDGFIKLLEEELSFLNKNKF